MERSGRPDVLFGPYGTVLEDRGRVLGIADLHDPLKLLEGGVYRDETIATARGYAAVADVATTNAYRLRTLLRSGNVQLYREAVEAHHSAVLEALNGQRKRLFHAVGGTFDGSYDPDNAPSAEDAKDFHAEQLATAKGLQGIEAVLFETINTSREALGIALAARESGVPVILSFVIDKQGNLLSGEGLADSIARIDAASGSYPIGYSLNCCPVEGIWPAISESNGQRGRIIGAYPNSSSADPRTFDESDGVIHLPDHNVRAAELGSMARAHRDLNFVGGCCGFDHAAVEALSRGIRSDK